MATAGLYKPSPKYKFRIDRWNEDGSITKGRRLFPTYVEALTYRMTDARCRDDERLEVTAVEATDTQSTMEEAL